MVNGLQGCDSMTLSYFLNDFVCCFFACWKFLYEISSSESLEDIALVASLTLLEFPHLLFSCCVQEYGGLLSEVSRLCAPHPIQMPFLLSQIAVALSGLYCKPLNSPITWVGKTLPISAAVFKLALWAFHGVPVGYLGILKFVRFLILSFAFSCTNTNTTQVLYLLVVCSYPLIL